MIDYIQLLFTDLLLPCRDLAHRGCKKAIQLLLRDNLPKEIRKINALKHIRFTHPVKKTVCVLPSGSRRQAVFAKIVEKSTMMRKDSKSGDLNHDTAHVALSAVSLH